MSVHDLPWLPAAIITAPLACALLILVGGRPLRRSAGWLTVATLAAALAGSVVLATGFFAGDRMGVAGPRYIWLALPEGADLALGTWVDSLSALMTVLVAGLATVVAWYSTWYLHDDPAQPRFFWQFSFFCSAMLGLVLSDNLLMTFLCWELVGLGSWFLIGFWSHKPAVADDPAERAMAEPGTWGLVPARLSPAHAQLKAFIINRVGDFGFLCGIALLTWVVLAQGLGGGGFLTWGQIATATAGGTVAHGGASPAFAGLGGGGLLTLVGIAVFLGAVGKSAQFPLHTWLPDAMQGPTTASSIIHAATMVAAGVYLVARLHPFFTPDALLVIQWTGAVTALLAATMATVQWDLKAVLAYSTISQLGFMLLALGSGGEAGYHAGVAHLFTHAIFKCLLFLCAAAVIHACAGNRNLHRMGGLWRTMPVTAAASGAAVLAILGVPLFSGFYSKDAVLAAALEGARGGGLAAVLPFWLGIASAVLTAYYMTRWWVRIFLGRSRDLQVTGHAHDPWLRGRVVLVVLALGCFQVVWTGSLSPVGGDGWFHDLIVPAAGGHPGEGPSLIGLWSFLSGASLKEAIGSALAHAMATDLALLALALGLATALVVWLVRGGALATRLAALPPLSWLRHLFANLWFIDRFQDLVVVRGGLRLARLLGAVDLGTTARVRGLEGGPSAHAGPHPPSIDGAVDGIAALVRWFGARGNALLTGRLNLYLGYALAITALALIAWWGW